MDLIEDRALPAAPERCDEKLFWTVSGEAVDRDLWGKFLDTADHQIHILFLRKNRKAGIFIPGCQIGSLQNMEKLQFDPLDILMIEITDRGKNILLRLSRKTQDRMDDNRNPAIPKFPDGLFKAGKRIAPADKSCCPFMDGLQAKVPQ